MYQNHPKTQYNECLICLQPLLKEISFVHIVHSLPLCTSCLQQFDIIDQTIDFHHFPLRILYRYNEFFQTLLYQYKGLYDYALKDAFLCLYVDELKQRYHDYMIIVAPSATIDNQVRHFSPVANIAKTFSHDIFEGLYKKEKYKQSDLSFEERKTVNRKIGLRDGEKLRGKKVLIVDDVITSGSTLLTCLNLVLLHHPKQVELLVLATKHFI